MRANLLLRLSVPSWRPPNNANNMSIDHNTFPRINLLIGDQFSSARNRLSPNNSIFKLHVSMPLKMQ